MAAEHILRGFLKPDTEPLRLALVRGEHTASVTLSPDACADLLRTVRGDLYRTKNDDLQDFVARLRLEVEAERDAKEAALRKVRTLTNKLAKGKR